MSNGSYLHLLYTVYAQPITIITGRKVMINEDQCLTCTHMSTLVRGFHLNRRAFVHQTSDPLMNMKPLHNKKKIISEHVGSVSTKAIFKLRLTQVTPPLKLDFIDVNWIFPPGPWPLDFQIALLAWCISVLRGYVSPISTSAQTLH